MLLKVLRGVCWGRCCVECAGEVERGLRECVKKVLYGLCLGSSVLGVWSLLRPVYITGDCLGCCVYYVARVCFLYHFFLPG